MRVGERWGEANGRDRFIRDESSKDRYDPGVTKVCFEILLELFERTLKLDLGAYEENLKVEDIC